MSQVTEKSRRKRDPESLLWHGVRSAPRALVDIKLNYRIAFAFASIGDVD